MTSSNRIGDSARTSARGLVSELKDLPTQAKKRLEWTTGGLRFTNPNGARRGAKCRVRFHISAAKILKSFQLAARDFTLIDMELERALEKTTTLCVELDVAVHESRCAFPKYSGQDVGPAAPNVAEIALRSWKFNLPFISSLQDTDLHQITHSFI